jgi:hypothetical protein
MRSFAAALGCYDRSPRLTGLPQALQMLKRLRPSQHWSLNCAYLFLSTLLRWQAGQKKTVVDARARVREACFSADL